MTYAVVRVRGSADLKPQIRDTLKMLRLRRPNHCVLVPADRQTTGMLNVAQGYITWGEVDADVLADVLAERGRVVGDEPLTDDHVRERTEHASIEELAGAVAAGKIRLRDVPEIKPVLRLHPPRRGYEGTKRPFDQGGALGYRGEEINDLLERMV